MGMTGFIRRVSPYLHLARVTTAFAAVANTWFAILWTLAMSDHEAGVSGLAGQPAWLLLVGGAGNALGLYAFGVCLNDLLDAKQDRAFRLDRPVAAGRVSTAAGLAAVSGTLMLAVLGATAFGERGVLITLLLAAAIMVFNAAGKFVPGVGLVMLGVIVAGHMLVPNPSIKFLWPMWLILTHVMVVALIRHVVGRKVPPVSRRAVVVSAGGWLACTLVVVVMSWRRGDPDDWLWARWVPWWSAVPPLVLVAAFGLFIHRRVRALGPGARTAEKIGRYGALWMALYGCGWLVGAGLWEESVILGTLTVIGWLGMTVLREWYSLIENPTGYRRGE